AISPGFPIPNSAFDIRWNDYAIGLLEQTQYGEAAAAFRKAAELNPADTMLLVNAAIAEMGTERFGPELEQFAKAELLLAAALQHDPANERALYYRALVWRAQGQGREAAATLRQLAARWPRDREIQRQLGQTLFALGALPEARNAMEAVLRVDPTDFLSWQFLSSLYLGENRQADADMAGKLYLQWRDDPVADTIAAKFYSTHPEWADERIRAHTHGVNSAARPVLTGVQAGPDK
ncbi:MAG: tetratricopeptide repeat protein, partial [Blastocatellia bacterium]